MKEIIKVSKKIVADAEEQDSRLTAFETKNLTSESAFNSVPDSDKVFLQKEITRLRSQLETIRSKKDSYFTDSQQITQSYENPTSDITPDDVLSLKENL